MPLLFGDLELTRLKREFGLRHIDLIVFGILGGIGIFAVLASIILVLNKGRIYRSLRPESRPRRWVLFSLLVVFVAFLVWFPVWLLWPHALMARILTALFGVAFFVVFMALRWRLLSDLIDSFVQRRGWPLR